MNLLTLAVACAPLPLIQDSQAESQGISWPLQRDDPRVAARMEDKLGFTIFEPQHIASHSLLRYVHEMTETKVHFFQENPTSGELGAQSRDRFIPMEGLIGIQDFTEGREGAMQLLLDLDTRLHAALDEPSEAPVRSNVQIRAVRLRSLQLETAKQLVLDVSPSVSVSAVQETGTIVLRGTIADVGYAETYLKKADEPLPQVALRCLVIKPVDPSDTEAKGAPVAGEIADSLRSLAPNKEFRSVGDLYLRGSAGGRSMFQVEASLPSLSEQSSAPAWATLQAVPRGLDLKTGVLTLDACELQLRIPRFQTMSMNGSTQSALDGYNIEKLSANLALRADETTVVGSLMGSSLYFALSFERVD
ncbi:MAG: hypothetical protein AAF726_25500 [Planctomycetota bacterium]